MLVETAPFIVTQHVKHTDMGRTLEILLSTVFSIIDWKNQVRRRKSDDPVIAEYKYLHRQAGLGILTGLWFGACAIGVFLLPIDVAPPFGGTVELVLSKVEQLFASAAGFCFMWAAWNVWRVVTFFDEREE